jgi:hypothetical protein
MKINKELRIPLSELIYETSLMFQPKWGSYLAQKSLSSEFIKNLSLVIAWKKSQQLVSVFTYFLPEREKLMILLEIILVYCVKKHSTRV